MDYPSQIEPPVEFAGDGKDAADTSVRRRNKFQRSVSIGGSGAGKKDSFISVDIEYVFIADFKNVTFIFRV